MHHTLVIFLVTLPWLNPFAAGPSPNVYPLLISLAASAGLIALRALSPNINKVGDDAPFGLHWAVPVSRAWILAGTISCVFALLQYSGHADALAPWVAKAGLGEAFANLRQRNQFATLTNIALAAVIWWSVRDAERFTSAVEPDRQRLLVFGAGVLALGNAASSSRTGMVQLFLVAGLWWYWGGGRTSPTRWLLWVSAVVYVLGILFLPWVVGLDPSVYGAAARFLAGDEPCVSRLTLWSNVLSLIGQKPWFGWGWGELDYAHYITAYQGPRFCQILDNAHNLPLQLAVELGLPASSLACGAFLYWMIQRTPWRETHPTRQLAWTVLFVILLHSMLEYPLWYGPFLMAFCLCIAMLWRRDDGAPISVQRSKSSATGRLSAVGMPLLGALLLIAAIYTAWDYRRVSQIYLPVDDRAMAYRSDTLAKVENSWLFADQVRFAQMSLTPLTPANAMWTFNTASALLHYSPEPRVIEKLIESAVMLGFDDVAVEHLARYRAAFPMEYAQWTRQNNKSTIGTPLRGAAEVRGGATL
ncbi:MAG: Wzy polymerase domain-containing protein [Polaromonas sp.]|uniref:PglL family O-oligosaccharyltransferase n=1 Tax=Polaromonas sp. TaxID=1869339 RepID=UPI003264996D